MTVPAEKLLVLRGPWFDKQREDNPSLLSLQPHSGVKMPQPAEWRALLHTLLSRAAIKLDQNTRNTVVRAFCFLWDPEQPRLFVALFI